MCFRRLEKHKVADKPITCYKVMNVYLNDDSNFELESLIYPCGKRYRIGDVMRPLQPIRVEAIDEMGYVFGGVIHSYGLKAIKRQDERGDIIGIRVCVKCEIPKGAVYWYRKHCDTYISKSLVIKSIMGHDDCVQEMVS